MTQYRAITTCNREGWELTGRRMAETFVEFWKGIELTVYAEGFSPDVPGITVAQLPSWLARFKVAHCGRPDAHGRATGVYDFRRDCIRFAHKVAAVCDAGAVTDGTLIWLDADTVTHAPVSDEWLDGLFSDPGYLAWLERRNTYPECGFLMFRTDHPAHVEIMERLGGMYRCGEVFSLPETHDSFVLQQVINGAVQEGLIERPTSLSKPGFEKGHVWLESRLAEKLDHMKGDRKHRGRSPKGERKSKDGIAYWL